MGITVWALHCVQCKVRNQVDLASETWPNRYGLRAAGTLCRASESCRHAALLLCIEGEVAPTTFRIYDVLCVADRKNIYFLGFPNFNIYFLTKKLDNVYFCAIYLV